MENVRSKVLDDVSIKTMRQWTANIDLNTAVNLIEHVLVELDDQKPDYALDVRYLISFQRQRLQQLTEEIFKRYKRDFRAKAKELTKYLWSEDYLLRKLMIIKNKAIIEMRTALRFAYDEESKEIVMENCYNLSEQIDKDMNAAISSNKDNSEE